MKLQDKINDTKGTINSIQKTIDNLEDKKYKYERELDGFKEQLEIEGDVTHVEFSIELNYKIKVAIPVLDLNKERYYCDMGGSCGVENRFDAERWFLQNFNDASCGFDANNPLDSYKIDKGRGIVNLENSGVWFELD